MKPDSLRELRRIEGPRGPAQQLEDPNAAGVTECPVDTGFVDDRLGLHDAERSYDGISNEGGKNSTSGSNEESGTKGVERALALLELKNLHVAIEDGTEIVRGVDLALNTGEVHAVMGPNGSGKSTLAYALMGHPAYEITEGEILLDGENMVEMEADERAQKGVFLAFQYPHAVPGVTVTNFLRSAVNATRKAKAGGEDDPIPIPEFRKELTAAMDSLRVPREMMSRYLNEGFSGGEKKRVEILQMAMLKPRVAVLDETDSGLDIDALKIVAAGVQQLVGPDMGALVITHYQRILDYIEPDHVHVFVEGRIVESGGPELAHKLEAEGYDAFIPETVAGGEAA
jgi:Fe-S cluster assembly ATP-binding protein